MRKILVSIISCVLIVGLLCACNNSTPQKTIAKFESAINSYDIKGVVSCYEPNVQAAYSGILAIGENIIGVSDLETILSGMGGLAGIINTNVPGTFPTVKIRTNSIDRVSPDKVLANLTITYNYPKDIQLPEDAVTEQDTSVYLVCIENVWYLSAEVPVQ